jgi:hypothetical protein
MAHLMTRRQESWLPKSIERWKDRALGHREEPDPTVKLLIAGAVVAGLSYLAWTYFGPDLKRYLKVHSM